MRKPMKAIYFTYFHLGLFSLYSLFFLYNGISGYFQLRPRFGLAPVILCLLMFLSPIFITAIVKLVFKTSLYASVLKSIVFVGLIVYLLVTRFHSLGVEVSKPSFQNGGGIVPIFFGIFFGALAFVVQLSVWGLDRFFINRL